MNTSFSKWDFVNTYGAFGSIGKERYELVIEGANDEKISEKTEWKEYEFVGKPTKLDKSLPFIAPYQPRIDWQIWFAAMERPIDNPWIFHFVWKLLENDKDALKLVQENPFPEKAPKFIRIQFKWW